MSVFVLFCEFCVSAICVSCVFCVFVLLCVRAGKHKLVYTGGVHARHGCDLCLRPGRAEANTGKRSVCREVKAVLTGHGHRV